MGEKSKCQCPHCGTNIKYELHLAGSTANCPSCDGEFDLPSLPPRAAAQPQPQPAPAPGGIPGLVDQPYPAPGQQFFPAAKGGLGLALSDPMDSQHAAMERLGKDGTLTWGLLLCLSFPIASLLALWRGTNLLTSFLGPNLGGADGPKKLKFLDHLEALVTMTALVGILFGVLFFLNIMQGRRVPGRCILFSTGLAVVPLAALSLYGLVMSFVAKQIKSPEAMEVIGYITTFLTILSLSSVLLLIFASLTSVIGYTRKLGFWLVPGVLMVTFILFNWISKLTGEIGKLGD